MKEEDRKIGPEIHCTDLKLSRNLSAHVRKSGVDEVTMMHGWIIRYLYENREQDIFQKDIEQRLMYQGLTLKQYTELTGKKESDLRKEFEEQANKNVKYRLVLEAIVKAENIEVDDKSVEEKLKEMAKNYGQKEEELLNNDNIKQYTKENMKVEKAIEFLVENAKMK